jgi:hypothetical protein
MNREREFAVMAVDLCQNHSIEDAVYQVIKQYGSELRREFSNRMNSKIDGDSPQHDWGITECINIVEQTTLKPTWPLS